MYNLIKKLMPLNRSIAGPANLLTLLELKKVNQKLNIKYFKSKKKVFDWEVPNEWIVKDAWIKKINGEKVLDFKKNNLHIVNYSIPKKETLIRLKDLKKRIFSIKEMPLAIPYITSYYKRNWGFCMAYSKLKNLTDEKYIIKIDSKIFPGKMNYGEILIKGKSKKEILLTTYICHPSMANNELSGPSLLIHLSKWIQNKKRKYSYRILFLSETIGSIAYIHKNIKDLKRKVLAGYVITCVGDDRTVSYVPSRNGNSIADKSALNILKKLKYKFKKFSWLERGSDERQFCWPNVDLPVCSVTRSKYHTFPEYHTSLDTLDGVVTKKGLNTSINIYKKILLDIEKKIFPITTSVCEPMLSKYNLYPKLGFYKKNDKDKNKSKLILNILSFCDGSNSVEEISQKCRIGLFLCQKIINLISKKKLIKLI